MIFVWAIVALVAVAVVAGLFGHVLLLGAIGVGGYLVGRGHERASARLAARRSRRALGP